MRDSLLSRWQKNFLAGLAVLLPAIVSVLVVVWLLDTVSNVTDLLLVFLPRAWTHQNGGQGALYWYWSAVAFLLAVLLIGFVGRLTRNYVGKKLIGWMDRGVMLVPFVNKIYGAIKQINEAFSSSKKSAFKTVVLIEFPRPGMYSLGFVTSEQNDEVQAKTRERVICVFVPTTPNPTSGWLVLVPEPDVTKLEMSVADAIKFVISLGSVSPPYHPPPDLPPIRQPGATVAGNVPS